MGRKRIHDKQFPARWKRDKGTIYYIVPKGQEEHWDGKKWFPLGKTETEAYRTWAARLESQDNITTMSELFDRYLLDHTPTVRPKTQEHHKRAIGNLRKVFGGVNVEDFQSSWAFKYYDKRKKDGLSAANTDLKVLNHCFSMAVKWGVIENKEHPTKGLQIRTSDKKRDRYVEDWELLEAIKVADDFMLNYIAFKLMTGMDKSTMLSIKLTDLNEEGIDAARVKTKGKVRTYEWNPSLRECVDNIKAIPRPADTEYLFSGTNGQPYINEDGYTWSFNDKWRTFMKNALSKTGLENKFTEHDLRAKAASDSESLEFARALLDHATGKMTDRYRRKKEKVKTRDIRLPRSN